MSWLRARMCSGSSCRYSIARMACSVPSMPRQRRPGHKPCLPRMKRRAVSLVMVSMMTSWRAWQPDRSERLWHLVPCSLLSSGQRSVGPEAGCESWSHVPLRDLSLLLNCKLRPAPDHRKRDGIPPCALRVSCSASSCLPWFHAGSTSTCSPQACAYRRDCGMWRDSFSARQNRKADEEAVSSRSHQWDECPSPPRL